MRPAPSSSSDQASFLAATRAGLTFLWRHPTARTVGLGLFTLVLFGALDNVALVVLAHDVFDSGAPGYGLLASVYGSGMVAASVLLLRRRLRGNAAIVLIVGNFLLGIGGLCTGLAPRFWLAFVAQLTAGIGNGLENVANDTLIQQTVPQEMLGRVFGTIYSGAFVASSLAYIVGGPLLDATSPRAVFLIAGCGVLATATLVAYLLRRGQVGG